MDSKELAYLGDECAGGRMKGPLFLVKWQDRRGAWRSKSFRSRIGARLWAVSYQFQDGYEKAAIVEET